MKKFTFLLLALFTVVLSVQSQVKIGNTTYDDIYLAITAANANEVILITGEHTLLSGALNISKSITLRGENPTVDIIEAADAAASDGLGSRVINIGAGNHNVTIENLGIRHGNFTENGGGIHVEKVIGQVTFNNLIIENNYSVKNGGGLGIAGSNVDIINCTIQNNSSTQDGGAIIAVSNNDNGNGINSVINIKQSLINNNTGRNGGGIYINGNVNFGDDFIISVNVENSTISNNMASSVSSDSGGGAIWSKAVPLTGDTSKGNVNLKLVHATIYNNGHIADPKATLSFINSNPSTNFSAYNSIIVSADLVAKKAINFLGATAVDIKNCIIGGLQNSNATLNNYIDANNNLRGKTATFAGLTGVLADLGGKTQVIDITENSTADDFCSAATGITIPTIDQRGYLREGVQDAGAFEFDGTLSVGDYIAKNSSVSIFPNPAKSILNIKSSNTVTRINIYDITGKQVFQSNKIYKNSINVSNLNAGLYVVRIEDVNNNFSTKKLVISR